MRTRMFPGGGRSASALAAWWLLAVLSIFGPGAWAACSPGTPANPIEAENCLTGTPKSTWDISGAGTGPQGFATNISVNKGETVDFKIDTSGVSSYTIDIYRLGYYGGNGARKVASVTPNSPRAQPNCLTNSTGLLDCGNWAVSASWPVPADAVSGIYFARVSSAGGASHIVFIVRDDSSRSDILFQTSDTTWQAYNDYGGNSLYGGSGPGSGGGSDGRAYKVSYNRPFDTRSVDNGQDWLFNAEYPMVRWLERNGYNVSYSTGVDTDRRGSLILNHKLFLSVGHDEYWSGPQRANVEAARDAGVHLAFFSGNEMFWKTRWENSIDGTGTAYRTLVCYKETHNFPNNPDPADPPTWTGTWRDPRNSPPADGGRPENAVLGPLFMVNAGATTSIKVPAADGKMRLWRNTDIATQAPGGTVTLPSGTLGYEWDTDEDNGSRHAGLVRMSTTIVNGAPVLTDWGSTFGSGTANHALSLYRASSGALVFGAGTVQWSWGLDSNHDRGSTAADSRMQQATVNLFADMGIQPATPQTNPILAAATASTDGIPPTSIITSPAAGATLPVGTQTTIQGTATDTGGGVVGGVEVSVDNGATWHPTTAPGGTPNSGRESWTYTWTPRNNGSAIILSRAADDSGNLQSPATSVSVTIGSGGGGGGTGCTSNCTSIWPSTAVPGLADQGPDSSVELGVKFRSEVAGTITGIRFYKATANTGTHVGSLWSNSGTRLASATFTGETASGWQQVNFAPPVAIAANTVYVASYHATGGHYSQDEQYFATAGVDSPPLHALDNGTGGGNGVYAYGASSLFPNQTFNSANYWVDVVFAPSSTTAGVAAVALSPATVSGGSPSSGTVTLTAPAPSAGLPITLTSDNPAATPSPANLTIPSGATSGGFTVNTTAVTTTATARITASDGTVGAQSTLTIAPPAQLSAIALSPATVAGGGSSTGTVTLTGPASAGGITVMLTSGNTGTATVPASVTVPVNASSTTFPINTTAVQTATPVTLTASYAGTNQTATLTVTPPPKLAMDPTVWATDRSTNSSTIAITGVSTAAANELLLAFVSTDAPNSGTNTTVTGITGGGLNWVLVRRTNVQRGTAEIWRAFAPSPLANATVTATLSRSTAASITVVAFTGADASGTNGSGAIGATGTGNANPGAPTASLTTTRDGSWVFGVGIDWDRAVSRTPGSNQTMVHQYLATIGDTYWVQRWTSPTPAAGTPVTINDTAPSGDRYNLSIVEVLPAP